MTRLGRSPSCGPCGFIDPCFAPSGFQCPPAVWKSGASQCPTVWTCAPCVPGVRPWTSSVKRSPPATSVATARPTSAPSGVRSIATACAPCAIGDPVAIESLSQAESMRAVVKTVVARANRRMLVSCGRVARLAARITPNAQPMRSLRSEKKGRATWSHGPEVQGRTQVGYVRRCWRSSGYFR